MSITLSPQDLQARITTILRAAGSSAGEAEAVASNLVLANLSGHDSHGVGMVPRYIDAVLEGGLVPNTSASVALDAGSLGIMAPMIETREPVETLVAACRYRPVRVLRSLAP